MRREDLRELAPIKQLSSVNDLETLYAKPPKKQPIAAIHNHGHIYGPERTIRIYAAKNITELFAKSSGVTRFLLNTQNVMRFAEEHNDEGTDPPHFMMTGVTTFQKDDGSVEKAKPIESQANSVGNLFHDGNVVTGISNKSGDFQPESALLVDALASLVALSDAGLIKVADNFKITHWEGKEVVHQVPFEVVKKFIAQRYSREQLANLRELSVNAEDLAVEFLKPKRAPRALPSALPHMPRFDLSFGEDVAQGEQENGEDRSHKISTDLFSFPSLPQGVQSTPMSRGSRRLFFASSSAKAAAEADQEKENPEQLTLSPTKLSPSSIFAARRLQQCTQSNADFNPFTSEIFVSPPQAKKLKKTPSPEDIQQDEHLSTLGN